MWPVVVVVTLAGRQDHAEVGQVPDEGAVEKLAAASARIPPEAGPVIAGMPMHEGGLDVVPPELRAPLADRAPRAYAAHSERVHGTPTPPRSTEVGVSTPYVGITAGADRH
jgi:hypothetical protein